MVTSKCRLDRGAIGFADAHCISQPNSEWCARTRIVQGLRVVNFDTTLDNVISERPPSWLPKDFKTYADLLRACYQDAVGVLKRNLGDDPSKWTWGNLQKARFPHPLAAVPFIGGQFAIAPLRQNGAGGTAATVNVGAAVSMRFIADPGDWDKTQQGIALGESGIPSRSSLERPARRLVKRYSESLPL